ncbi:MAG: hypothetical protein JNK60_02115 [Acidobacteria bacterium]|nr:hypothetical protein [Acidobacteriota bacterium]
MRDVPVLLLAGPSSRKLAEVALEHAARLVSRASHPGPDDADVARVLSGRHPDVCIAAPERRRRLNLPEFAEASESKETTIPAALIRALAADATRMPYEAPCRAILLLDVDRTESAAFSALLKVLEEPPQAARFILTATRPRILPPTILSRVVLARLPGQTRQETEGALLANGKSEEEAAARAAFLPWETEGALELDLPAARAYRDALLTAVSGLFITGKTSWAVSLGGLLADEGAAPTAQNLNLLGLLLRDAAAATVEPAHVVHRERQLDLARLGAAVSGERLIDAASRALELGAELSDSRRNSRMAAEAFALRLL